MPDRDRAGQAVDHLAAGEALADEAHAALGMEALAVVVDDAGRFLAAMLERVQSERRDRGGVRVAEHAEDAALLTQPVVVEAVCVGSFDHVAHLPSKSSACGDRALNGAALDQSLHPGPIGLPIGGLARAVAEAAALARLRIRRLILGL